MTPKGRPATNYAEFIGQRIERLMLFRKFELVERPESNDPMYPLSFRISDYSGLETRVAKCRSTSDTDLACATE
jgi:hypothetical protein